VRRSLALLSASLMALALAAPALAETPVNLRSAADYSVLANAVTSDGATAMSEDLGSTAPLAGTPAPIVLGQTRIGAAAAPAKADMELAYGDAVLRGPAGSIPADLAGARFGPGVYNAPGARGFTASGVMTLDAGNDANAVFIFQIGGALTVGASAQVKLVGGANACNVFWAVGDAATFGATAQFAGTLMAIQAITVGAGTRVDGRLLGRGAITLDSNPVRTACAAPVVVTGPAGPAGPAGAVGPAGPTGAAGVDGAIGPAGPTGPTGAAGPAGATGADGAAGTAGTNGTQGATGLTGTNGADGATGAQGAAGLMGGNGLMGATGLAGINGIDGAPGATGLAGTRGTDGAPGATGLAGPAGVNSTAVPSSATASTSHLGVAGTTKLCVTDTANVPKVRQAGFVTWIIVVKNCGAHAAVGVAVTSRLRKGASLAHGGGAGTVGRPLRWNTGTLAPGARVTYKVGIRINRDARTGKYVNRAIADGHNTRPSSGQGSTIVRPARAVSPPA
jgi:hypothetical protein